MNAIRPIYAIHDHCARFVLLRMEMNADVAISVDYVDLKCAIFNFTYFHSCVTINRIV